MFSFQDVKNQVPEGSFIYTITRKDGRCRWVDAYAIANDRLRRIIINNDELYTFDVERGYCIGGTGFNASHALVSALGQKVADNPDYYRFENLRTF